MRAIPSPRQPPPLLQAITFASPFWCSTSQDLFRKFVDFSFLSAGSAFPGLVAKSSRLFIFLSLAMRVRRNPFFPDRGQFCVSPRRTGSFRGGPPSSKVQFFFRVNLFFFHLTFRSELRECTQLRYPDTFSQKKGLPFVVRQTSSPLVQISPACTVSIPVLQILYSLLLLSFFSSSQGLTRNLPLKADRPGSCAKPFRGR